MAQPETLSGDVESQILEASTAEPQHQQQLQLDSLFDEFCGRQCIGFVEGNKKNMCWCGRTEDRHHKIR